MGIDSVVSEILGQIFIRTFLRVREYIPKTGDKINRYILDKCQELLQCSLCSYVESKIVGRPFTQIFEQYRSRPEGQTCIDFYKSRKESDAICNL